MKNKIFFAIFIVTWVLLIVLNFVIPKINFSEQENRVLTAFPKFSFEKLINGEYMEQMDSYINDHFIFRNQWLKVKSSWEVATGKTENNGIYIGKEGYMFEKFIDSNEKEENLKLAANNINAVAQIVDVPCYFILVPNSIYINQEKLPPNVEVANQQAIIEKMYHSMPNVTTIDVTQKLWDNKEKSLYFKTDHHMTSEGAFVVYQQFSDIVGLGEKTIEQYEKQTVSQEFLGTYDSKAQILNQVSDTIDVYYNFYNTNLKEVQYDTKTTQSLFATEYLSKKDKYSFFLNGNNAKVVIKTRQTNGKKLLMIKDSYAHILTPFLCEDYEEIHLIDPRYYQPSISTYAKENGISEILFLYNVSNMSTDLGIRSIR